ncbi:MAG TPA: FkbM family methyltransferase [Bacteroidia bacterium]|nr:FkbM family methyltransferase [Bacteroidia bacterium]
MINRLLFPLKQLFTLSFFDSRLAALTKGKSMDNLFVKLLPSNLQYSKNDVRLTEVNGVKYQLYLNQWMEYALYFGIQTEDKAALYKLIKPDFHVIDVGVNFGETLLNIAKLTGANGHVIGFEPMPAIFKKCQDNMKLNTFANITLEPFALSDVEATVQITDPLNGNSGGTYISSAFTNSSLQVQAITLDDYLNRHSINKIDLIKIDVEGYELHVLQGAKQTLLKHKPVLYIELCDAHLKRAGNSSLALIVFLQALNYGIKKADTGETITSLNMQQYQWIDICCTPHA